MSLSSIFPESDITGLFGIPVGGKKCKSKPPSSQIKCLPPEVEEGNVEYKLKLLGVLPLRLEHLITQMQWRLKEGNGEAFYKLGVADTGAIIGLTEKDMEETVGNIRSMAKRLGVSAEIVERNPVGGDKDNTKSYLVMRIFNSPKNKDFTEIQVAVLGNTDAGKSTLIGVLTNQELDNGRGKARLSIFRHKHEIETGRTSSISREILGFDGDGKSLYIGCSSTMGHWANKGIDHEKVSKIVTLIDLAGFPKYFKTTAAGLMSHCPDFALIAVSGTSGISDVTREHISLAIALKLRFALVITKRDRCKENANVLYRNAFAKEFPEWEFPILETEMDENFPSFMHKPNVAPVIFVSCVSGQNLRLVEKILCNISPRKVCAKKQSESAELHVIESFEIPEQGHIIFGRLVAGSIHAGDELLLGPDDKCQYVPVKIKSIHRTRSPFQSVNTGQISSLAVDLPSECKIRCGMIMCCPRRELCSYPGFDVTLSHILEFDSAMVGELEGSKILVYCGCVKQSMEVTSVYYEKEDISLIKSLSLKFVKRPEFVSPASPVLFWRPYFKATGIVSQVL
eukprot:Nk52_evm43s151 gene=Nk52_evmTU43s151